MMPVASQTAKDDLNFETRMIALLNAKDATTFFSYQLVAKRLT